MKTKSRRKKKIRKFLAKHYIVYELTRSFIGVILLTWFLISQYNKYGYIP